MKKRLDILLVEQGLCASREKAKAHIMAGEVYVDGVRQDKAGFAAPEEAKLELRGSVIPYVSRGGLKLAKAVQEFSLELSDKLCLDIGASTGGFTDCMLKNGAGKVYAVDTGYGQLDYSLRTNPRVVSMERTNFRYSGPEDFPELFDFASADVSFISLEKILPGAYRCLADDGEMVCLIKPQFEAGREKVGKNGVVREKAVHKEVIERICGFAEALGFRIRGLSFSPIRGPKGNIEYLLYLGKDPRKQDEQSVDPMRTVDEAHAFFDLHKQEQG